MRSARLLAVVVLAVVLAVSSGQNAFAATELYYDAGPPPTSNISLPEGRYLAVRFSVSTAKLLTAKIWWDFGVGMVNLHVLGSDRTTNLITPFPVTVTAATLGHWSDYELGGVIVSGDFYVAVEYLAGPTPAVGTSGPLQAGRDWYTYPVGVWQEETSPPAFMIRAVVEPVAPVGGVVTPANTFAIVAPWLAVIGVVGCIGTVVVLASKSRP
jgi:hypothetical protein